LPSCRPNNILMSKNQRVGSLQRRVGRAPAAEDDVRELERASAACATLLGVSRSSPMERKAAREEAFLLREGRNYRALPPPDASPSRPESGDEGGSLFR
jgi:hypothetical protein